MNGTPQPGHLNPDIDHWEKCPDANVIVDTFQDIFVEL